MDPADPADLESGSDLIIGTRAHSNWIGGQWVAAAGGHTFDDPGAPPERWPRSDAPDLEAALDTLAGQREWSRFDRAARHALLIEAARHLREDLTLSAELGRGLGLDDDEAHWFVDEDLFQLEQALEILREGSSDPSAERGERGERGMVGLFRAHWSDRVGRLGARVASHLLRGERVLLFSDSRLPQAAEAWVRALVAAGVPADALALLAGDTPAVVDLGLARDELAWARLAGDADELALRSARARPGLLGPASLWPLGDRTLAVLAETDLDEAVARTVRLAFGRWTTLSGQTPGRIGRVVCHERRFSRFTELLLEALAGDADVARPVPLLEEGARGRLVATWDLGLDEGATPIFGCRPGERPPSDAPGDAPRDLTGDSPRDLTGDLSGDPAGVGGKPRIGPLEALPFGAGIESGYLGGRRDRGAQPVVFTNVEAHHRLARLRRPEPVLRLLRAPSDPAVRGLAAELDRT